MNLNHAILFLVDGELPVTTFIDDNESLLVPVDPKSNGLANLSPHDLVLAIRSQSKKTLIKTLRIECVYSDLSIRLVLNEHGNRLVIAVCVGLNLPLI